MSEGEIDCQAVKQESENKTAIDEVSPVAEQSSTPQELNDEKAREPEVRQEATNQGTDGPGAPAGQESGEQAQTEKEQSVPGEMNQAEEQAKEIAQEVVKECDIEEVTTPEVEQNDKSQQTDEKSKIEPDHTVAASLPLVGAQQEVSSTNHRDDDRPKSRSSHRRPSYSGGRGYAGGSYQNYGLTYLPYKSNFEPSEAARRRADEFIKTLKL